MVCIYIYTTIVFSIETALLFVHSFKQCMVHSLLSITYEKAIPLRFEVYTNEINIS